MYGNVFRRFEASIEVSCYWWAINQQKAPRSQYEHILDDIKGIGQETRILGHIIHRYTNRYCICMLIIVGDAVYIHSRWYRSGMAGVVRFQIS